MTPIFRQKVSIFLWAIPVHGSDNDPWTNDTHTHDRLVNIRLTFSLGCLRILQVIQVFS